MAKQTRRHFPNQANYRATRKLELVHADLCGPISSVTPGGSQYFLLLVDDYSRRMWVFLLKRKDEAFYAFNKFKVLVENGNEDKVKTLRTDRGGEFMSKELLSYCEDMGITRQFTTPYSLQQNGFIERWNRTVVEMARSFMKEMHMPSIY